MKICIAQLNPIVGDIDGNRYLLEKAVQSAFKDNATLIIFSELFLVGYPPQDKQLDSEFKKNVLDAHDKIKTFSLSLPTIGILFGSLDYLTSKTREGESVGFSQNSIFFVTNGKMEKVSSKTLLPNYDVFDESRYHYAFDSNAQRSTNMLNFSGKRIGISVCEDMWFSQNKSIYKTDPIDRFRNQNIDIIVNISASPYEVGKDRNRKEIIQFISSDFNVPVVFVNQVGGNDGLIFDGGSGVFTDKICLRLPHFKEAVVSIDIDHLTIKKNSKFETYGPVGVNKLDEMFPLILKSDLDHILDALSVGIRDYVIKTGFSTIILGLSGGIDSALTAYLAVRAIGKSNVVGVTMPSKYSSKGSVDDSYELAANLGMACSTIPIEPMVEGVMETLLPSFENKAPDFTEENIQARLRGITLMALSNKHGHLLLTTGNKSELAIGYCTLYGDMCGALNPIGDLYKTQVYQICEHINKKEGSSIIPDNSLTKAPSAELRLDQKDQDTLPEYDVLDIVLNAFIVENKTLDEIIKRGYDKKVVSWIYNKVRQNEYKRYQSPPVLKVSKKAFGIGRRMPIAAR
jgi:NAD+ synthase (glutamine-hydrolysing)